MRYHITELSPEKSSIGIFLEQLEITCLSLHKSEKSMKIKCENVFPQNIGMYFQAKYFEPEIQKF